jgi:CRISPR-associated endonuclease/helicase Cas3
MLDLAFPDTFETITGHSPFPWQEALYDRFVAGSFPDSCNLPTGLGKTSVIPIWLIALAANPAKVPRRLVYVVNRRTVVDQATNEAQEIRKQLQRGGALSEALGELCALPCDTPLAISTLRGQFADNGEWSSDPCRPAIILGTVDMIGSRLLFSGYGLGFRSKPLHAGFLGQDALVVHDEAHLEPAFQALLLSVQDEQRRCGDYRSLRAMELTATSRRAEAFGLTERDQVIPEVRKRIGARKTVVLHEVQNKQALPDALGDLALRHKDSGCAVLVFARTVEDVEKIAGKIGKAGCAVECLTGTLRGKERDELVQGPAFRRFLPKRETGEESIFLVCTSAGEVGVNISADHLVCDLSTFESMAQRFGRVNRFGAREDTRIDVVRRIDLDEEDEYDSRLRKTWKLLEALDGDGSPEALGKLEPDDRAAAFSPPPLVLSASDILFDTWALTSIRDKLPGRPPVEPYLHGISESEPPQTRVAWREEVGLITGALLDRYEPADLLDNYPLKPHELLRDRSDRVWRRLASLAERRPEQPAWLLGDDSSLEVLSLAQLADKNNKERIDSCTVVLSPFAGGLKGGLLTGDPADRADDVADEWRDEQDQPRRRRVWDDEEPPPGMRLVLAIDTKPDLDELGPEEGGVPPERFWRWYVRPWSSDDDSSRTGRKAVAWEVHTNDVARNAESIVRKLPLPDAEGRAVVVAARHHDLGKKRVVWQRAIGNRDRTVWLAKSGAGMVPNELTEYRHELGSLVDVVDQAEFLELDEAARDVVLHLIAVHHGLGRPHFEAEQAFDPEPKGMDVDQIATQVPRRFARLQRRYGRWGLAYLESLLRAADYAASAAPSATLEDSK